MKVRIIDPRSRHYYMIYDCVDFGPEDKVAFLKIGERASDIALTPIETSSIEVVVE